MNKDLLYLPKRCHAVLPFDGRLVTITRGGSGYQLSPLDKGSRTENRIIADEMNAKLGGVTPEQEKDMIDGAIFGWELLLYRNGGLLPKDKVLQVEISGTGHESYNTAVSLNMPATWAEFHDALQKARIRDGRTCRNVLSQVRRKDLPVKCIGSNVNLYELNLLAQRLAWQAKDQKICFEGMLKIEQERTPGVIPLPRLINLTFNLDNCCVASGVKDDKALGRFLYENEMLSDEAFQLIDAEGLDSEYANELLAVLGKKHREGVGGVFTRHGYLEVAGGDFQEVYIPGEMAYFLRTDAPVVLEVSKGFFNDPRCDNNLAAGLDLPASGNAIWRAAEAVDAAAPKECCYHCTECLIPAARELIDAAIDDAGDIKPANEFARLLNEKRRQWNEADLIKYKALLEASGCASLQDATQLMQGLEQYELLPEISSSWSYAERKLREKYPDLPEALFQTGQSAQIRDQMLAEDHAALTDYGLLRRKDGQPLPDLRQAAHGITQRIE